MKREHTICLCMIVKDEEVDIKRCLDSVAPYIDYWVISDTGSSDNTMQKIQEIMDGHDVPGELHEHKWEDFSTNRNHVIKLARSKADYLWFMDADDDFVSEVDDPFSNIQESADLYYFQYQLHDGTLFDRQAMFPSSAPIIYHGVIHEFLSYADLSDLEKGKVSMVKDCMINARSSPTKRADKKEKKYLNDANLIKEALKDPKLDQRLMPRYLYYLGMSYKEAGKYKKAISSYKKRLKYGARGEHHERYLALKDIADIKKSLHKTQELYGQDDIINSYLMVWEEFPTRIEPIVQLMDFLFHKRRFLLALMVAELPTKTMVANEGDILHNKADYTYNFPAQYAACAVEAGFKEFAIKTAESAAAKLEGVEKEYMKKLLDSIKQL